MKRPDNRTEATSSLWTTNRSAVHEGEGRGERGGGGGGGEHKWVLEFLMYRRKQGHLYVASGS